MTVSPEIIASLDEGVRQYLLDGRDEYFNLLLLSTVIVAVGIVMEGPEVVHDTKEEILRYLFRSKSALKVDGPTGLPIYEHRLNWMKLTASLGWLLIVIGVSGEFVLDSLVSQSDSQVQTFNNIITKFGVAEANLRAEEARATASGFEGQIAASNKEAKLATARARSAEALAKRYELQIATFETRAKEAEARAEGARSLAAADNLARVKIEDRLAGWRLSPEAWGRLRLRIEPFPDTPFEFWANPVESRFLDILDQLLSAAKWKREKPRNEKGSEIPILLSSKAAIIFVSGITLEVAQESWPRLGPAMTALIEGLIAEGIPAKESVVTGHRIDPSAIHVVIGNRE
jgi:hypothetical protein